MYKPAGIHQVARDLTRHTRAAVKFLAGLGLVACLSATAAAGTGEWQSSQAIRDAAVDFVHAQLGGRRGDSEVTAGRLDSRLRLPACGVPLRAYLPPGTTLKHNNSVGVRCEQPRWSLYVSVNVATFRQVLVASEPLMRGTRPSPQQLHRERRDTTSLPWGYFTDPADLGGQQLKRYVAPGTVLTPSMLGRRLLVRRGERVMLIAGDGPVQVGMQGEALADGRLNDRIRVRNLSSRRIVEGTVRSAHKVEVN